MPWDQIVRGVLTGTAADGRSLEELQAENARIAEQRKKQTEAQKAGKKLEPEPLTDKPWRVGYATAQHAGRVLRNNLKFRVQAGPRKGQIDPQPLAQHVATAFLGVRLECAECHKHPHDRWSQQDFFGFTAAFAYLNRGLSTRRCERRSSTSQRHATSPTQPLETFPDPRTGEPLPPRALGGPVIDVKPGVDPRLEVWKWMVAPDNPYFARAIVNRVWAHYFGRGLIDPVDALAAANPPSHPEVLDELVRDFVAHKYDLRHLHRRILNTARLSARLGDERDQRQRRAELLAPRAAADVGRAGARRRSPQVDRHAGAARPASTAATGDTARSSGPIEYAAEPAGRRRQLRAEDLRQAAADAELRLRARRDAEPEPGAVLLQRRGADREDHRPERPTGEAAGRRSRTTASCWRSCTC